MKIFRDQNLFVTKSTTEAELFEKTNPLIGIHGMRGSFNEQALHRYLTEEIQTDQPYEIKELVESQEVIRNVAEGEVDLGIFAVANSGGGGVQSAIETMGKYNFSLVALFTMPVEMCLISHAKALRNNLSAITAHPVATSMCRKTLQENYPEMTLNPKGDELDTALSVKMLTEGTIPPTNCVLASELAAEIYGGQIIKKSVQDDPNNATVFAIIKK